MRKAQISWTDRLKRLFAHELKPYLVDEKYKVIPAFSIGGVDYWMFESSTEVPSGRFFAAKGVFYEMEMNCDKEYLTSLHKAIDKVISDPKKISIKTLALLNTYLGERIELMPFEDHIYKFASVIFFDKTESLYAYDYDYNKKKIEKWKAAGGTLDFFSRTPLKELVPFLNTPVVDFLTYSTVTNAIKEIHQEHLISILSDES